METVATSLKLPSSLKRELERLATRSGQSPHAYMVQAISAQVERDRRYAQFAQDALDAERHALESGDVYDFDEVAAYVRQRVRGEKAAMPKARRWLK
jgi:predicted transcriptional regulator